jgi:HK97 family phage portal protein
MNWLSKSMHRILKGLAFNTIGTPLSAWFGPVFEPFTGAWQKNVYYENNESLLRNSAVYACVTGIASDVAKMRIKLCRNEDGIWTEITNNQPWLPLLRKPNHYQTRIEFLEQWIISKLLHGNAYVLKERQDLRGLVTALYVLDPHRVLPLVTPEGDVYYQLNPDNLSRIQDETITVPASEIIHDRMPALWHPLIGIAPLYACMTSGMLANRIQRHSVKFFNNHAAPGGMLLVPGDLTKEKAAELKENFERNYSGENIGRIVVLTGGMTFEKVEMMSAHQAELAAQLKLTTEDIARAFHYPLFKLGGPVPTLAGNVEALITTYYTDCLQALIEKVELCLDEGLSLPAGMGTELDLDNLMRMDTAALYEANNKAVGGGWMAPNEARFKANFKAVPGGATPYLQQQNYSLAALAKRDAQPDPFAKSALPAPLNVKAYDTETVRLAGYGRARKRLIG